MPGGLEKNTGGGRPWPAPPRRLRSQCTQWTASDHVEASPPNHLHKQHTQGVDSEGTRIQKSKCSSLEWISAHLIVHSGQRLVFSGHSQFVQLMGLGKSLLLTCQQQSRLNYNRKECQPTQWVHLEYLAWVIGEAVPVDPVGYLLHLATLSSLGDLAALLNI